MTTIDYTKAQTMRARVTADEAAQMLTRNVDNRPLSASRVRDMAEKMTRLGALRATIGSRQPTDDEIVAAGAWLFTHQGVGFDNEGHLVDGQHRLSAQVRAGVTLDWVVTTGLAPQAFDRTDVGDSRSAADLLSRRMPGLKNKSLCAAAARSAILGLSGHSIDREVVVNFVERHADMVDGFVRELRKNKTTGRAPIIGAFIAAARPLTDAFDGPKGGRHIDLLMVCATRLAGQEWLDRNNDPLKTLHNRLVNDERAALKSGRSTDPRSLYGLVVSAIRAELAGRGMTNIPGTEIDWGDPRDTIREGTGDLAGRRSAAVLAAYEAGRISKDPAKAAPLAAWRARQVKVADVAEPKRPAPVVGRAR